MGETVFLEEGHEEELRAVLNEETAPTVLGAFAVHWLNLMKLRLML